MMTTTTATPSGRFVARKHKILEQLDAPAAEYHDLSPKGSVDAPIRDLIDEINGLDGLVTTSSCSGRISVFLEGRKAGPDGARALDEGEETRAGPGGKGGGGAWLFISHDAVEVPSASEALSFTEKFGLQRAAGDQVTPDVHARFIHLKFEPMVGEDYIATCKLSNVVYRSSTS
jgi:tRNA wybutosine-synthesizing protein 3